MPLLPPIVQSGRCKLKKYRAPQSPELTHDPLARLWVTPMATPLLAPVSMALRVRVKRPPVVPLLFLQMFETSKLLGEMVLFGLIVR